MKALYSNEQLDDNISHFTNANLGLLQVYKWQLI